MRLTLDHFKKSAKRHADQSGQPLSKAQEDLAIALGFASFHDVVQRLSPKAPSPGTGQNRKPSSSAIATAFAVCAIVVALPGFLGTGTATIFGSGSNPAGSIGASPSIVSGPADPSGEIVSRTIGGSSRESMSAPKTGGDEASLKTWQEIQYSTTIRIDVDMPKAYTALVGMCTSPCEVIDSSQEIYDASVKMRIPKRQGMKLMDQLGSIGEVVSQQQKQTDRTREVIDAEAQAQNLTAYRDQLRQLLSQSKTAEAAIEVSRELHQVQAQIDAAKGLRADLRDRTEMVQLHVRLIPEKLAIQTGWTKVKKSIESSGENFLESASVIIDYLSILTPWALLGGAGWLFSIAVAKRITPKKESSDEEQIGTVSSRQSAEADRDASP